MAGRLTASFRRQLTPVLGIAADLELQSGDGRILVLFGPSGSGKTTILRCLAGLDRPQQGFIRFDGETWFDADRGVHVPPQPRQLGYVSQEYGLFPHMTVAENVRFGMRDAGAASRVAEILSTVHLDGKASRLPSQLSGGERQRVALARVLAREPRLILLDEPLAALDLPLRDPMRRELREFLRAIDVPSIIVTHDRVDALTIGDRMAVLSGGRIRQIGAVDEVFSRPADLEVAASVGVETVAPGEVVEVKDGVATVSVGTAMVYAADLASPSRTVFVCIRSEDVMLERTGRDQVSARNRLAGIVTAVQPDGGVVRVTLDCGFPLGALITKPSFAELGLGLGAAVTAVVKATAVHLVPRIS